MGEVAKSYNAQFNIYTTMAHYVAKVLHQRPNDILDKWCVPELVVAFGEYANEETQRNYEQWKSLDTATRAKTQKPNRYAVYFHDRSEDWNLSEYNSN